MLTIFLIILIIILLAIIILLFFKFSQNNKNQQNETWTQMFINLQNQLNDLSKIIDTKLSESHRSLQTQFGQSYKIIKDVTEKLTQLDKTNQQVINFAEQLKNLQDILKNPKQRGILGEFYLETLLKNVLPPSAYQMQYKLGKDEQGKDLIVDAVIFIDNKIIPIDAKFSLENYNKLLNENNPELRKKLEIQLKNDLKARIDETSKYIQPKYNTLDFAFMFIPAEAIFYDLLVNKIGTHKISTKDLIEYAFIQKKVIITSPTSFFAYLQTVLQGLRALKIEESAKEIRKRVELLGKHIINYDNYMQKLGNHLSTTVNTYNKAYQEFHKIDKDIMKIENRKQKLIEPKIIEKPTQYKNDEL